MEEESPPPISPLDVHTLWITGIRICLVSGPNMCDQNLTYSIASTPDVTGSVFMRIFRLFGMEHFIEYGE